MRITALLPGAVLLSGVSCSPLYVNLDLGSLLGIDLSGANHSVLQFHPGILALTLAGTLEIALTCSRD